MSHKITYLMILQITLICTNFLYDWHSQELNTFKLVIFGLLIGFSVILIANYCKFSNDLIQVIHAVKRTLNGNLTTRIFANGTPIFNEMVFSINELIEKLEKIQVETIQTHAARKSLLSSISHDIRTPLTSIIGYLDALKDDIAASEEEKKEYLNIVSKKSNNLKQLIDEIFNMAKLDADEMPLQPDIIDFSEITRELLIEYLPEIKRSELELKINIPERKCLIMADRLSIVRIIENILKNAILYGKEGKEGKVLGIELKENDKEFELLIWDRGPGIPKTESEKVFERMYRGDQSRSSGHSGSGLGLSIAKALIEKNQGRVWVDSTPYIKTTFGIAFGKIKLTRT
ncbi:HAMP domain-containing sensor histidine kinase [Bacillus siamensis]|uniref:sensor histidine kinase n=1 Tax=Bacillus siamensis TaxID=659243 RepID=UPI002E1DC719|nr:HAMP domain-containing sensor histidine kinase [Bacillus siamensis]MED5098395.1 HAMP domain-containing sensor histidine kinase [Bacillus siamensis]